jgi:hypothetical protein
MENIKITTMSEDETNKLMRHILISKIKEAVTISATKALGSFLQDVGGKLIKAADEAGVKKLEIK